MRASDRFIDIAYDNGDCIVTASVRVTAPLIDVGGLPPAHRSAEIYGASLRGNALRERLVGAGVGVVYLDHIGTWIPAGAI